MYRWPRLHNTGYLSTDQLRVLPSARPLRFINIWFDSQLWLSCHFDLGWSRRGWRSVVQKPFHLTTFLCTKLKMGLHGLYCQVVRAIYRFLLRKPWRLHLSYKKHAQCAGRQRPFEKVPTVWYTRLRLRLFSSFPSISHKKGVTKYVLIPVSKFHLNSHWNCQAAGLK